MLRHVTPVGTDILGALSSPKRQFLQEQHGVTSQKMAFFLVTAMKTANLTKYFNFIMHYI
jgi:hypothetical protein